jgi:non-heme chloroperoxidase
MYAAYTLSQPLEGTVNIIRTADGADLYTMVMGDGEKTVVLAHGYGFTLNEWNVIAPRLLASGCRVILFDQRGHGHSGIGPQKISTVMMAADYCTVLEYYNVKHAILAGHSMGGFLAIKALLDHPEFMRERIERLVLIASFAGNINKKNIQNRLQICLMRTGLLIRLMSIKSFGKAFARSLMGDNPDPEVMRAVLDMFLSQNHPALLPILSAFGEESYYDQLYKITLPCTVLIGSRDKTSPPFHTNDLVRLIPNAQKVTVEGKGHPLNWEAPEAICDVILKYNPREILPKRSKQFS